MADIRDVGSHFQIEGSFVSAQPYGTGHINDTYAALYRQEGAETRVIHQRINHAIFADPPSLMKNIERVTRHIRETMAADGESDLPRKVLTLIPTREGTPYHRDGNGNYWRTYRFIEGARTYDVIETPRHAYETAKAFGRFQRMLIGIPGPRLTETIPDFHHGPKRFERLMKAIREDPFKRAEDARAEIDFAARHEQIVHALPDLQKRGEIPERITHNDTKINNVMLDDSTGEGICVIDLDTVMPGLALYDFGDMVRTATSPAKEDERDLSKVFMRMDLFEALARGYWASAGGFLNEAERQRLSFSGKLITLLIGIRFLTDYLEGDTYFKIHREGHNLDRCRTQFKLIASIEEQEEAMNRLVRAITAKPS